MSKILKFLLLFILITNCSLDKKTGFWSKPEEIKKNKNLIVEKLFENEKSYNEEFNLNLKIKLSKNFNVTRLSELSNNNGRIDYESELKKISKFKYSKIDNFNKFEPDIIIDEKSIIFFDKKGTLLKFDKNSKLIWKKNYYSKGEKKIGPLINLASYNNYLIITDNLAKYYAVDINTGNLLWMKQNKAPFNSQVKIHKNKIYTVNFVNAIDSTLNIALTETTDAVPLNNESVYVESGTDNQGKTYHYNSTTKLWVKSQTKTKVNQQPLFGMWDEDDVSFDDETARLIHQMTINITNEVFRNLPNILDSISAKLREEADLRYKCSLQGNWITYANKECDKFK